MAQIMTDFNEEMVLKHQFKLVHDLESARRGGTHVCFQRHLNRWTPQWESHYNIFGTYYFQRGVYELGLGGDSGFRVLKARDIERRIATKCDNALEKVMQDVATELKRDLPDGVELSFSSHRTKVYPAIEVLKSSSQDFEIAYANLREAAKKLGIDIEADR